MEAPDVVIIGAGAAGLMAGIWAARAGQRVVLVDGARTLGAKILVAGGGRCNVTHDVVDDSAYAGSTRPAIRKVLRRFDVPRTIEFFASLGVELKREETGKLFPVTDDARTVLDALVLALRDVGGEILHPRRVDAVARTSEGFVVRGAWGELNAKRLILATGGKSLPKTGSDGGGYLLARLLGHTITERIFPSLVPLTLPEGHPLRELSGLTLDTEVRLVSSTGKVRERFVNSTLCTHFGLSGPSILDVSRYLLDARGSDPGARLELSFLPSTNAEMLDRELVEHPPATALVWMKGRLPERLVRTLCGFADVDPTGPLRQLSREARKRLVGTMTALPVEPSGDRGWTYAEATAGGVPLSELRLESMESRICPKLFVIGELCDVDGRIGGFNFQWAWASGFVAGCAGQGGTE